MKTFSKAALSGNEATRTSDLNASEITCRLNGRWYGRYGTAPCPICQPDARREQSALTLSDGAERLLLHCKKSGCGFRDILAAGGIQAGDYTPPDPAFIAQRREADERQAQRRAAQSSETWAEAIPAAGTLAESYLRSRGITAPVHEHIRFHASCWHGPSAQRHPSMLAAVTRLDGLSRPAIHRTYLRSDGMGKADIEPAKMMLGACAGGCVRLSEQAGPLVVAEGVETAMSLVSGLLSEPVAAVAALSTSGMRSLVLPPAPGRLIIAPDGETAGRDAATALGERATALGWRVEMADPGDGVDWNDVLRAQRAEAAA